MKPFRLSRRAVLRGTGAAISLPLLEAMFSRDSEAQAANTTRWGVFYFPMGCHERDWEIGAASDGRPQVPDFLNGTLGRIRDRITWFTGLHNRQSGYGDHETAAGCFLNCATMVRSGPTFAISADQIVANQQMENYRIPSLTLSAPGFKNAADCCRDVEAGLNYISWRDARTPTTKLQHPRDVFARLFPGDGAPVTQGQAVQRRLRRGSILDFARGQATRLERRLGYSDRERLRHYLNSVRELELRIERESTFEASCGATESPPTDISFESHTQLMFELAFVAMQCSATPVITYIMDFEFSDRNIRIDGVTGGHHGVSHHGGNEGNIRQLRLINNYYAGHFTNLVERCAEARDVTGAPLLDASLLMLCSGMSDGNDHDRGWIPMVVAGTANGRVPGGRVLSTSAPLAALFRTTMRLCGASGPEVDDFGTDSGGELDGFARG